VSQCRGLTSGIWAAASCDSRPLVSGALVLRCSFVLCCQGFLTRWSWRWAWGRHPLALPFTFPRLLSRYYGCARTVVLWPCLATRWQLGGPVALFICGLTSSILLCFAYCFAHTASVFCYAFLLVTLRGIYTPRLSSVAPGFDP
jgi:hypothetical protein